MLLVLESIVTTMFILTNKKVIADTSCSSLVGNAANKYHLKLKESFLILKIKPPLNVAKESMPLHLFENDS